MVRRRAWPDSIKISERSSVRADIRESASNTTAARMKVETGRSTVRVVSFSFQDP